MQWMTGLSATWTYGANFGYLVVPDLRGSGTAPAGVRLSRFSIAAGTQGLSSVVARESAVNVIVFPLGRGPGRPAGEPELAALTETAKGYAERFEAGEDLEGYPAWQHLRRDPEFRLPEGDVARFAAGPVLVRFANQLPRARLTARVQCLAYKCPDCDADPTWPCRTADGLRAAVPHAARQDLYRREADILEDGEDGAGAPPV